MPLRSCIKDHRKVRSGDLVPHELNPRTHSTEQRRALRSLIGDLGYKAISTTTHPAMIQARCKCPHWQMTRSPSFAHSNEGGLQHATTRLTAGFKYVGRAMERRQAERLLGR